MGIHRLNNAHRMQMPGSPVAPVAPPPTGNSRLPDPFSDNWPGLRAKTPGPQDQLRERVRKFCTVYHLTMLEFAERSAAFWNQTPSWMQAKIMLKGDWQDQVRFCKSINVKPEAQELFRLFCESVRMAYEENVSFENLILGGGK